MCGRFALGISREKIKKRFGLDAIARAPARYNIAPGQLVEALIWDDALAAKRMTLLRWGLVPFWGRDASRVRPMHNARAETVWEKPLFKAAARRRRCLVPAQGFYEWSGPKGRREPWFIAGGDGDVLAFAGIWDRCETPGGEVLETLAILTCPANAFMAPIHGRMPVLIAPEDDMRWLAPGDARQQDLEDLLAVRPWPRMTAWRVSALVNRPDAEGPELAGPRAPGRGG